MLFSEPGCIPANVASLFGVIPHEKLKELLENLIVNENAQVFLFGSRSNFDYYCHNAITELKESVIHVDTKLAHWKVNENIGKNCIANKKRSSSLFRG